MYPNQQKGSRDQTYQHINSPIMLMELGRMICADLFVEVEVVFVKTSRL